MRIYPLNDNILIKPEEAETKTSGGIYVPEGSKEKPSIGVVEGTTTKEIGVGLRVIYKKWAGNEVKLEGQIYILADKKDILGLIK